MTETTKKIAALNDAARTTGAGCRMVATAALDALGADKVRTVLKKVREYDAFDPAGQEDGNDPHGEHDFGAFDFEGLTIFWKFDYYSDTRYQYGAEDPSDPSTARVLTVMLSSDY